MFLPFSPGPVHAEGPRHRLTFTPQGRLVHVGERSNPSDDELSEFTLVNSVVGARIIVGFNVNSKPRWKLDDLIEFTLGNKTGGATFLAQKGVWRTYNAETGKTDDDPEDGGQVILLNLPYERPGHKSYVPPKPEAEFFRSTRALARHLQVTMDQDVVLYEEQRNGISTGLYQVHRQ